MTVSLKTQSRAEQLADAILLIAKIDHYMIGLVEPVSQDELDEAKQILIEMENEFQLGLSETSDEYKAIGLALDLIENKTF